MKIDYSKLSKETISIIEFFRYDSLTGLRLRKEFEQDIEERFDNSSFFLTLIDVNGLHNMNRLQGYFAGDSLIRGVVNTLKIRYPNGDLYKIGGDEFAIISDGNQKCKTSKNFCAYSLNSEHYDTWEELFKDCDAGLIQEKANFYKDKKTDRRR